MTSNPSRAWREDDTPASYRNRRQELFRELGAEFRVCSGAPKGRWHILACYSQFPSGHILAGWGSCNLVDKAGRLRTFSNAELAQHALDKFLDNKP